MKKVLVSLVAVMALAGCSSTAPVEEPVSSKATTHTPSAKPSADAHDGSNSSTESPIGLVENTLGCFAFPDESGTDFTCGNVLITDWTGFGMSPAEIEKYVSDNVKDGLAEDYIILGNTTVQGPKKDIAKVAEAAK